MCFTGDIKGKETLTVKIDSYANGQGVLDLTGVGKMAITCQQKSFSKNGQDISTDLSDCAHGVAQVKSIQYCSDQGTMAITLKKGWFTLSSTLAQTDCPSEALQLATTQASCSGSDDVPAGDLPMCFTGDIKGKETLTVKID